MSKSPSVRNQESSFDEDGRKRRDKSTGTTSSRSAKKAKFSLALAETLTVYNETAKRKIDLYENSMTLTKHHLLDECIEALNQIDGISGEVYAKAIEKFESEVSRALVLFACAEYNRLYLTKEPCRNSALSGHEYVMEVLHGHESRCYDLFRMDKDVFILFCGVLKEKNLLRNSRYLSVEEQVSMFLFVVGHNERHRVVAERFQHSTSTISEYFRKVLRAVCRLSKELITPPSFDVVPPEIRFNPKYYPFLKNCVGAIDGTHISAHVPIDEQIPYRGRKVDTTQNVMCICSFDMKFTYVVAGWEGSANDARILSECATNPDYEFPAPPNGKYYLVDSGYTNMPGFLSPYRGERYHLNQYADRNPLGKRELFNYRHSSLRNVIERCFGVLKARFPILKQMPSYDLKIQKYIVIACCGIPNFIRTNAEKDIYFDGDEDIPEVQDTTIQSTHETLNDSVEFSISRDQIREMANVRDEIADHIWRANRR
ncbi:protein ALP1-like [Cannabis sativa]|nr:protein ALP1-like [Cannabis sativa]XP_060961643.1 protein ALP1-like [Cannabis sativa]